MFISSNLIIGVLLSVLGVLLLCGVVVPRMLRDEQKLPLDVASPITHIGNRSNSDYVVSIGDRGYPLWRKVRKFIQTLYREDTL